MSNRLRGTFLNGIVTSITAGNPGTLTLASGLNLAIPSGYYLPIVLNPPPYAQVSGITVLSEIVWTSGTYSLGTNIFTVLRGQEGSSSLGSQTNIPYAVGPTPQDFGINNWQANGDFPAPSISGSFLASTSGGVSTPTWVFGYLVPGGGTSGQIVTIGAGGVPILSNSISGINIQGLTISGSEVYGNLPNATISGTQIVGNITGISGYLSNVSVSGSQVWGYLPNSTISGSQVVGPISGSQISGTLTRVTVVSGTYNYGTLTSGTVNDSVITNSTISGNILTNNTILNTTFSGSILNNVVITSPIENASVINQGVYFTTLQTNLQASSIFYYTVPGSGNFYVNAMWQGSTVNSALGVGQSLSFVLLNTNGSTAYVISGFQIDGVAQALHWQGGTAPTQGNPNATDYYSFSIIKVNASPTYWVTVGLTKVA